MSADWTLSIWQTALCLNSELSTRNLFNFVKCHCPRSKPWQFDGTYLHTNKFRFSGHSIAAITLKYTLLLSGNCLSQMHQEIWKQEWFQLHKIRNVQLQGLSLLFILHVVNIYTIKNRTKQTQIIQSRHAWKSKKNPDGLVGGPPESKATLNEDANHYTKHTQQIHNHEEKTQSITDQGYTHNNVQ